MSITPKQAQDNLAEIVNEYLVLLQRDGKKVCAQLIKNLADESLAVIESAIPKPEAKPE